MQSKDAEVSEKALRKGLKDKFPCLTYEEAVQALKAEASLYEFVVQAWNVIHAERFTEGKHIRLVADHLQAVTEGHIKNLLIAEPPRHSKSSMVSVFWPAWEWTKKPGLGYLCISHRLDLTGRDSDLCRELMQSDWYQKRWGHVWQFKKNQNARSRWSNNMGGTRISTTRQGATGEGGDRIIIDDIISAEKVEKSKVEIEAANRWYATSIALRKNNPNIATVIMMQRLHENDLIGYLMRTEPEKWTQLFLPLLFVPERKCITPYGEDWRTEPGEYLWPEQYNQHEGGAQAYVDGFLNQLGEYGFSCQCQQHPVPATGGIFQQGWWRLAFCIPKGEMPLFFTSWDLATKKGQENDYTVGIVFCHIPRTGDYYIIDVIRKRMEFVEAEETILATALKYPRCIAHVIEEYGSGNAIIARLEKAKQEGQMNGEIVGTRLSQDKPSRYRAVAPIVKAGRVYIFVQALWAKLFLQEMSMLPMSTHDDQGDSFAQGLIWCESREAPPTVQVWNPNKTEANGSFDNMFNGNPRDNSGHVTLRSGVVLPKFF